VLAERVIDARRGAVCLLAGLLLLSAASCRRSPTDNGGDGSPIVSRFQQNEEGWTQMGDGILHHFPTGGNPGSSGYILIVDRALGDNFYFVAPARFRGNRGDFFGRYLRFDLTWSETSASEYKHAPDIILVGGGITLHAQLPELPGTTWTSYAIPLDTRGDWVRADTNQAATALEILSVLGNLTSLRIRGEFRTGPEQGGLDNVEFGAEE
jgi:hypothetical protein